MKDFYWEELTDEIKDIITGVSYPEDDTDAEISYEDLCLVHVLHKNFEGGTSEGRLIVNKTIGDTVLEIFKELFEADYPIERIELIDYYDADDLKSMAANNSSAFCYRNIWGTDELSNHSLGYAIDINPRYNPYISYHDGVEVIQPDNFIPRDENNPHVIDHDDMAYIIMTNHGFEWGGDWTDSRDYHHFQKVK